MFIQFRTLLSQCSKTHQTLLNTKQLHALIAKTHLVYDPFFATKLTRYYALNGDLSSAHQLFDESPERSIYLWNSIIRAYAKVHDFKNAFNLFTSFLSQIYGLITSHLLAFCALARRIMMWRELKLFMVG